MQDIGDKMRGVTYIREYNVDSGANVLSKDELAVFDKLIEAARAMAEVYKLQLDEKGQPLFYPKRTTRTEIEKAASKDPDIRSPYTIVERDKNGELVAVPYHIKYKPQLLLVAQKLEEAAELSMNSAFAQALKVQAKVLLSGDYDKAQITWIKIKPYVLSIVIGPIEPIEDELFFNKRSYQAVVGVLSGGLTGRATAFKDAALASKKRVDGEGALNYINKTQIRVDHTAIFAGVMAKYLFTATTLPNDVEIVERYGSETFIFLPAVKELFSTRHFPLFNKIFAPHFRQSFTQSNLQRGYLYTIIMHEIGRVVIRYKYAPDRLKELYSIFGDLAYESVGIKMCGSLLLKDVISQKEMESVLVIFITRIFDFYYEMKDNPWMKSFVLGNAVLLNSLLSSGALVLTKDGISWPNFTKMFIAVSNLADELEKIVAEGNYKTAASYLKKHSSLKAFHQFKRAFDKVNPKM